MPGRISCSRENSTGQEACWQQAWAADPEMLDALYALADLYQDEEREQEAQAVLERISAWNCENGQEASHFSAFGMSMKTATSRKEIIRWILF